MYLQVDKKPPSFNVSEPAVIPETRTLPSIRYNNEKMEICSQALSPGPSQSRYQFAIPAPAILSMSTRLCRCTTAGNHTTNEEHHKI